MENGQDALLIEDVCLETAGLETVAQYMQLPTEIPKAGEIDLVGTPLVDSLESLPQESSLETSPDQPKEIPAPRASTLQRIKDKISEWPEIFMLAHLCNKKPTWPWNENGRRAYTDIYEIKVMEIAFNFTPEETEIYNELANLDMLWPNRKNQKTPVDVVFGKGDHYGNSAEFVWLLVHYLFCKREPTYGEPYEPPKRVLRHIHNYRTFVKKEYATPQEWLADVFVLKHRKPPRRTIEYIIEDCYLERKWKIKEKDAAEHRPKKETIPKEDAKMYPNEENGCEKIREKFAL
jgi:hypothetical protein